MIQEALDFGDILEEDNTPYCIKCGDELLEDINWWISYIKSCKYLCKPCSSKLSKINREPNRAANLDPNKEWDPKYTRTCPRCKLELNAEGNFWRDTNSTDGYASWCSKCTKKGKQTPKSKWITLRSGARRRGYRFTLTFEDCSGLFLDDCHYCGKPSVEEVKIHGLDRVDNEKGYSMDNVVTCCEQCNVAKSTQTYEDFIQQANDIAKRHPLNKEKLNVDWIKGYLEYSEVGENNI